MATVSCANVNICRECVQFNDPKFTQGRDIFEFQYDCNSPERGDAVCLECAVVCEFGRLREPLLSGMFKAADAIDALFGEGTFHPKRTLPRLYFHLWKEVLSCGNIDISSRCPSAAFPTMETHSSAGEMQTVVSEQPDGDI